MAKKVLYITYDGLTDPLGQSQILPYLKGLSKYNYSFTVLSFEKGDTFKSQKAYVTKLVAESGIQWVPLSFTRKPPLVSKFYDFLRMKAKALTLHRKMHFDMVHCRSYIAADIGLRMKKKFGLKFFFDMRGFWADEKKDGGSWDISKPLFRRVYQYYKDKETQYLQNADQVISLTEAGKQEILQWPGVNRLLPLEVIPCCTDMDRFSLTDAKQKSRSREHLALPGGDLVISYLGSIGTWYMLKEMLQFFSRLKTKFSTARFLFVTQTPRKIIDQHISQLDLNPADFLIVAASPAEVPFIMKSSDINISFIKPVYSKISSSPTKLGEVLSMGIPVICNSRVGDVQAIIEKADAGVVVHDFTQTDFDSAVNSIPCLLKKDPAKIRNAIKDYYSLTRGVELYAGCYNKVLNG